MDQARKPNLSRRTTVAAKRTARASLRYAKAPLSPQPLPDRRRPPPDAAAVGDLPAAGLIREPVLHFCDQFGLRGGEALFVDAMDQGNHHPVPIIGRGCAGPRCHAAHHIILLLEDMNLLGQDHHVRRRDRDAACGIGDQQPILPVQALNAAHDPFCRPSAAAAEEQQQFHRGEHHLARDDFLATANGGDAGQDPEPARIGPPSAISP